MKGFSFSRLLLLVASMIAMCVLITAIPSCSPEKKLHRLLKKHPHLVKSDTIWRTDYDTIPQIQINTVFKTDTTTRGLDSIFNSFQGQLDAALAAQMKGEIRNYIVNRPFLPDTITQVKDGVTVKIYQDGENIGLIVHRDQEIKKELQPATINTVSGSSDQMRAWQNRMFPFALILTLILFIIYVIKTKRT